MQVPAIAPCRQRRIVIEDFAAFLLPRPTHGEMETYPAGV
jgi:hypothetical protein